MIKSGQLSVRTAAQLQKLWVNVMQRISESCKMIRCWSNWKKAWNKTVHGKRFCVHVCVCVYRCIILHVRETDSDYGCFSSTGPCYVEHDIFCQWVPVFAKQTVSLENSKQIMVPIRTNTRTTTRTGVMGAAHTCGKKNEPCHFYVPVQCTQDRPFAWSSLYHIICPTHM